MKNLFFLLAILFSVSFMNAQSENSSSDTTKIKLGGKTIIIIENEKSSSNKTIKVEEKIDKEYVEETEKIKKPKKYKVRKYSRWAGLYLGINQLGDIRDAGPLLSNSPWQINPWKSRIWNINFMEMNLSIIKRHLLLTTGLGFEFKNFAFTENIDLVENDRKQINPIKNNAYKYTKDKLHVSYFQIPLLLEFNTSSRPKKGLYLAGGLVGGVRMYSKLYQEYDSDENEIENKTSSNFNLSPFQLYGTLRVGFNKFTLFGNFDLLPLFEDGKSDTGDNLMVVSTGIKLLGF